MIRILGMIFRGDPMAAGVFVFSDQGSLVAMKPASFAKEDDFQHLIAENPDLLSGEQIAPKAPRRWLLLDREKAIPSEDGGSDRWAVDHLFVDQDGVPTLVEVKRQEDSRLRREVVGQMLDYAANATAYWRVEELRTAFQSKHQNPEEAIRQHLGLEGDQEGFWQIIKTNLRPAGFGCCLLQTAFRSSCAA
jgi:hypothetical protein